MESLLFKCLVRKTVVLICFFFCINTYSQSDIDKVLKGGEILINGLSFLKNNKTENKTINSKMIESVCIKNKLPNRIIFSLVGKNEDGDVVKKEMIIQNEGKECVFELPKGIYEYEIVLSNKEVYKKGEYKFNEATIITVKEE